jgi:uncharacterized LabA/DUF88 family protein
VQVEGRFNVVKRTAVFIDGSNLHATILNQKMQVDYAKLLKVFDDGSVCQFKWFTAIPADKEEFSSFRPVFDYLSYNGFVMVTKPTKIIEGKMKGNMDVEIVLHAMELRDCISHLILFSGDGDFTGLVVALQSRGVYVTVVSTRNMIADELRRACNKELDISDYKSQLLPDTPRRSRFIMPT